MERLENADLVYTSRTKTSSVYCTPAVTKYLTYSKLSARNKYLTYCISQKLSKNLAGYRFENNFIHQNNCVERLNIFDNVAKCSNILATSSNVLS